jgi:hypothetical protein
MLFFFSDELRGKLGALEDLVLLRILGTEKVMLKRMSFNSPFRVFTNVKVKDIG